MVIFSSIVIKVEFDKEMRVYAAILAVVLLIILSTIMLELKLRADDVSLIEVTANHLVQTLGRNRLISYSYSC